MSDTRDAYVKKMKAKLDEWNAEITKLEAKVRQKEADAQKEFEEQVKTLKEKRESAQRDLDNLLKAGGNAWEDLKAGVERAANSLGDAVQSAKSQF